MKGVCVGKRIGSGKKTGEAFCIVYYNALENGVEGYIANSLFLSGDFLLNASNLKVNDKIDFGFNQKGFLQDFEVLK